MPKVNIKTGVAPVVENPSLIFPYKTDDFQNHSFISIGAGDHLLVTAHTGSGKTTIAEYAVAHGLKTGKKVIYTAPIKALSNQIFNDFKLKYPDWDVGIRTGDIDYNSESCRVLIMTTEIIKNLIYLESESLKEVSIVVFDEVHWIKDKSRGSVWEEAIMMMPKEIQMVMLSATLPDAVQFCEWIADCKNRDVSWTTTNTRVVPLSHYLMDSKKMHLIMDNEGKFNRDVFRSFKHEFESSDLNKYIPRMDLPALFFCFSKKNCERYAKAITVSLIDSYTANLINSEFMKLILKFDPAFIRMPETHQMLNLLCQGVGYHHAGLLPPIKEIVQEMFSMGYIKVLFVTETFAAGVNLPAKTVVFTGFSKSTGESGFRYLLPEEYSQMSGRAGRRGKDIKGTVIHLPFNSKRDSLDVKDAEKMMSGFVNPIVSRYRMDYSYVLKWICKETAVEYLDCSLLSLQEKEKNSLIVKEFTDKTAFLNTMSCPRKETERAISYDTHYKSHMLSKKDIKTYQKEILPWITANYKEFSEAILYFQLSKEIKSLKTTLDSFKERYFIKLNVLSQFLFRNEYLNCQKDFKDYKKSDLTVKGIMLLEVNECNPIMLTELIYNTYLDNLEFPDIIAILALFLDIKGEPRDITWSFNARKAKVEYLKHMDDLEVLENSPETDWSTNDYLCDICKLWVKETLAPDLKPITDQLGVYDLFPGEFVRMMLKLNNICKEATKIAKICGKDELIKKLDLHQQSIIRGIVTPQSLYV